MAIQPFKVYDGGYKEGEIQLRIGNGGAGQTGLIGDLANNFIKYQVQVEKSKPFKIAWYESDTTYSIQYLDEEITDIGVTYNYHAEKVAVDNGIAKPEITYAFRDHFLLIGPKDDPAKIENAGSVEQMFTRLYTQAQATVNKPGAVRFLSRFDKSATNIQESDLWIRIGQVPWATSYTTWYHQYIAFPLEALTAAALLGEYTLTDFGTYLHLPHELRDKIKIFKKGSDDEKDPLLLPAHSLIGTKAKNMDMAEAFNKWLKNDGKSVVEAFRLPGEDVQVYDRAP
ncbi:hypothetical protein ASPWEDRAFT_51831 [Aspergillus wentii DTO 134E9]|uniref:PBP domain-containing protein n=1 Tax=Aspergillus wentii DTO 134E9 TaxID=1073089 RepID=A0A1L9RLV8_ASPWE|nr:uncharacterized protein ASPWEDRAFT_51831 [Aspergillus wentii DTO 134E9]OJJ35911.1 hypothetical protein ASPWEDRAFT_51831 [Aspergillus wentii DTO 134E9]